MPPAVTLIELCDLANRVLTNGSGNTATILDSLTERSRILAAQAAEVDLPGPAHLLKIGRPTRQEGAAICAATRTPFTAQMCRASSGDQRQRPPSTDVARVRIEVVKEGTAATLPNLAVL